MSAQSATSRKSKSAHTSSDDAIVARALEFGEWAKTNIRVIVISAIVLTALVGGLLYYRIYRADREARAAAEFVRLQGTLSAGNAELAQRDLLAYIRRYEGSTQATEAKLALAELYLRSDSAAKAVALLQDSPTDIDDPSLGPQSALLLAGAQVAAGDAAAAEQTYLEIADEIDLSIYRIQALQSAAILRSEAGNHAGAAELYAQLIETQEEGSVDRQFFEMRLAESQAKAAEGAPAPK